MYLDYAVHPTTRAIYTFPKRQADLTVANNRRNSTFIVPGGGGPINPKGLNPFDREPNIITYQFQLNPLGDRAHGTVDDQRESFLRAVDHGVPQTLAFRADDGTAWFATCALVGDPHHQTAFSNANHVIEASWVMLADFLRSPATPGTSVYGQHIKYGKPANAIYDSGRQQWYGGTPDGIHGKYGANAIKLALSGQWNTLLLDNTTLGATAPTTDPIITIKGNFGSTGAATGDPTCVTCQESNTGFTIPFVIGPNDTLEVNLAARRVLLNNQPVFGKIAKTNPAANAYLAILPDIINTVQVFWRTGPASGTQNGQASFNWQPKRTL